MNKQEFITRLSEKLSGLPQTDIEERLAFYSEMIDDRMEDGISEEEAVFAIGDVDSIARQIIAEFPLFKIAKERISAKRRLTAWEITLLAIGSPIWLSLGIAAVSVILALYASLWCVIISLWAVFLCFAACFIAFVAAGGFFAFSDNVLTGIAVFGAGIICAGLSIFVFFGCKAATNGILKLTKKFAVWIKSCFIKKGEA